MKNILINILYYIVLFFKYFYIYTHNFFTWFYNLLAKTFKWNIRFYYAQEETPEDTTLNKIKAFFSFKKKDKNQNDLVSFYKQKYFDSRLQTNKIFKKYQLCIKELEKFENKYKVEKHLVQNLKNELIILKQKIESLRLRKAESNPSDKRTSMRILGLYEGYTLKSVKTAYKRLVSRYHPDKHIHMSNNFRNETNEEFNKIQNAYNELLKNLQ